MRPKLPLNIQNIEICCSGLYGLWYSQHLVIVTYTLLVKMRRSMFKARIEIKLDRPSKTVKTPRESMGTESEYFSTVFIQLRSRLVKTGFHIFAVITGLQDKINP